METYTIKEIKENKLLYIQLENIEQYNKLKNIEGNKLTTYRKDGYWYSFTNEDWYMSWTNTGNDICIKFSQIDFEEFVLPEKWCIKESLDDCIGDFYNKKTSSSFYGKRFDRILKSHCGNVCIINHKYGNSMSYSGYNNTFTEITFEQFKKHILKTEEKEIIGYKLIKKLEGFNVEINQIIINPDKYPFCRALTEYFEPQYKEEELKLGNYTIEFKKNSIKIHNQEFDNEEIRFMLEFKKKFSGNSIKVYAGEMTVELLEQILTKLKSNG